MFCHSVLMLWSSVYDVSFNGSCGVGMTGVYICNSVGDINLSCGTPCFELAMC